MEIFSQYVEDEKFPQLDGADDDLSPTELTLKMDKEKNFHPQPGPSHLFISPLRYPVKVEEPSPSSNILNNQEVQKNLMQLANQFNKSPEADMSDLEEDDEDDDHIKSF